MIRTPQSRRSRACITSSRSATVRAGAGAELDAAELPAIGRARTVQAGTRTRRAAVRRQAIRAGAAATSRRCGRGADGDDRELVQLRLAECDYFLKRPRRARRRAALSSSKASRQGEALYFYAVASRDLGDRGEYLRRRPAHRRRVPDPELGGRGAEQPGDAIHRPGRRRQADAVFRELYRSIRRALRRARGVEDRLAAYRSGRYADTVRVVRARRRRFPRSDYRPAWLYWSGRAHERSASEPTLAEERYALVATDYLNSYYGRLALKRLDGRRGRSTGRGPRPDRRGRRRCCAAAAERGGRPGAARRRAVR